MSSDKNPANSKNIANEDWASQSEPQIHPKLQSEVQLGDDKAQNQLEVKEQPQIHPMLESQLHHQAPVSTEAQTLVLVMDETQKVESEPPWKNEAQQAGPQPAVEGVAQPAESQAPASDLAQQLEPQAPAQVMNQQAEVRKPTPVIRHPVRRPVPQVGEVEALTQFPAPIPVAPIPPLPKIVDPTQFNIKPEAFISAPQPEPSDPISQLQARAELGRSRVELMNTTIDILVTTFKNKYSLDKELEKKYGKLLKASDFVTTDAQAREDLEILANSPQWVKEQLEYLNRCIVAKHSEAHHAGPLIDTKYQRKLEEKQVKQIEELADKIRRRAQKRQVGQEKRDLKKSEQQMVEDAWKQLPSDSTASGLNGAGIPQQQM